MMLQACKHMAVRLWAAVVIGSLSALVVLPILARPMGPDFMALPALFLIALGYWLLGMTFSFFGRRRLDRLMNEATVWERAGMAREARQTLAKAESTLDSFYFSPFSRKKPARKLLARLARFQLSQSHPGPDSDGIVGRYLRLFPTDREAAIKWLERALSGRSLTIHSYEIAAAIGSAHEEDPAIQRMLARFYLDEGCCDFAALGTFRLLVEGEDPLEDELLGGIINLFLSQQRADKLALEVYIMGHRRGRAGALLMEGIAACRHLVLPTPLTQPLLDAADVILEKSSATQRRAMATNFLPEIDEKQDATPKPKKRLPRLTIGPTLLKAWGKTGQVVRKTVSEIVFAGQKIGSGLSSRPARQALKWGALGVFAICVGWLAVTTVLHVARELEPVQQAPEPVLVPVADPFTLQVAAYLKEDDARRYVDQLKEKGLDAYWTPATGNNKTWYQVRVSHFKTKNAARSMGETLKKQHFIDDYYVANYKRSDTQ